MNEWWEERTEIEEQRSANQRHRSRQVSKRERKMEYDRERAREQEVIQEETDGLKAWRGEGHSVRGRQLLAYHLGSSSGVSRTVSPVRGAAV